MNSKLVCLLVATSFVGLALAAVPAAASQDPPFGLNPKECASDLAAGEMCERPCVIGSDGDCVIPIYCIMEPCP